MTPYQKMSESAKSAEIDLSEYHYVPQRYYGRIFASVVILLLLFLGEWRASVVVASMLPFASLFTFLLMQLTGQSANLMSMGALDFGLIVDGEPFVRSPQRAAAQA